MEDVKKSYHCDICGKDFKLSVTFKAHTVLHERESPYKCSWCGDVFVKSSIALKDHMRKHLDNWEKRKKSYEHNYSNEDNKSNEKNKEHQVGVVNYACNYCQKKLSSNYNLVRHLRTHTGERPFHCSMCNKKYICKESLNCHIRKRHTRAPSFICEFCGEKFYTKSVLDRHSRMHQNKVEYKCEECEKVYRSKKVLDNHKRSHVIAMEKKNRKRAQAIAIDKKNQEMFETTVEKNEHEMSIEVLKKNQDNFADTTCSSEEVRDYYGNPIEELTSNVVEKNYTCSSCGKNLSSHKSVLNHMLMHAESALYSCKLCGIAFSNKAQLRMHVEKHADCNKFVDNVSVVCEALESQEKITLYIKNDRTIKSNDRKIFMLEERGIHCDTEGAPTKKKRRKSGTSKREDVMVIDEDVVIDVEEVIIAEKGDDEVLDTDILY